MFAPVDIYCERTDPTLWAEPFNALTNLVFLLVSYASWRLARQRDVTQTPLVQPLIVLIAVIGLASFSFHSFAVNLTGVADGLSILFYQLVFLTAYSRFTMRLAPIGVAGLLAAFLLTGPMLHALLPMTVIEIARSSVAYLPALIFLSGFALYHVRHVPTERYTLLIAALVFGASLVLRTLDLPLCATWPLGTHFLWHLFNALVLYLTARAYIISLPGVTQR